MLLLRIICVKQNGFHLAFSRKVDRRVLHVHRRMPVGSGGRVEKLPTLSGFSSKPGPLFPYLLKLP